MARRSKVPKLAKLVAWLCVVNGVLTLLTPLALFYLKGQIPPLTAIAIWSLLGLVSLVGGYFGLKEKRWAFWLLFAMFMVQVAST